MIDVPRSPWILGFGDMETRLCVSDACERLWSWCYRECCEGGMEVSSDCNIRGRMSIVSFHTCVCMCVCVFLAISSAGYGLCWYYFMLPVVYTVQ